MVRQGSPVETMFGPSVESPEKTYLFTKVVFII